MLSKGKAMTSPTPETAQQLRDKFEADLKSLQDTCPHTESEVMQSMWAPGHMGGMVRVCKVCEAVLGDN